MRRACKYDVKCRTQHSSEWLMIHSVWVFVVQIAAHKWNLSIRPCIHYAIILRMAFIFYFLIPSFNYVESCTKITIIQCGLTWRSRSPVANQMKIIKLFRTKKLFFAFLNAINSLSPLHGKKTSRVGCVECCHWRRAGVCVCGRWTYFFFCVRSFSDCA